MIDSRMEDDKWHWALENTAIKDYTVALIIFKKYIQL